MSILYCLPQHFQRNPLIYSKHTNYGKMETPLGIKSIPIFESLLNHFISHNIVFWYFMPLSLLIIEHLNSPTSQQVSLPHMNTSLSESLHLS